MTIRNPGIGSKPAPVGIRNGEPGKPTTAHLIANLNQQIEAFWSECNGNRHSWHWPDPDTAPTATITAPNTATEYDIGDGTESCRFEIPWQMQDGFDHVGISIWVVIGDHLRFEIAVDSDDMVAAVAQVEGGWRGLTNFSLPPLGRWHPSGPVPWRIARVNLVAVPTVDANRRCAFHFKARVVDDATNLYSTSVAYNTRIYALQMWDIPSEPGGLY